MDEKLFAPQNRSESLRKSWGINELDRVMLSVSRVAAEKNLNIVCELFSKMIKENKAKIGIIVGDGPERARLSKKYPEIVFTGCLTKENLAKHYASADLFLFASQTETFGNVVTEALSSGLPVIAYDYAAASEYINDKKNGRLSPIGDINSLTNNLENLLACSGLKLAKMASYARLSTRKADWKIINKFHNDLIIATSDSPFKTRDFALKRKYLSGE